MITEVLINIQADRKQWKLLLRLVLRDVFIVNALASLKTRGEEAFATDVNGGALLRLSELQR